MNSYYSFILVLALCLCAGGLFIYDGMQNRYLARVQIPLGLLIIELDLFLLYKLG